MKRFQDLFKGSAAIAEDNLGFLEDLYSRYQKDPESVDSSWREKFRLIQEEPSQLRLPDEDRRTQAMPEGFEARIRKQAGVDQLIYHYRKRGHQVANNNPLAIEPPRQLRDLDPKTYGLDLADLDSSFYVDILESNRQLPLREIIALLQQTYCGNVAAEYMHIVDSDIRLWVQARLENTRSQALPSPEERQRLILKLTAAEGIERYLHRKYVGQKRFSLEGAESLIPLLDQVLEVGSAQGLKEMVIGMAHRGRLNVLVNVLGKRPGSLFEEFEGTSKNQPHVSAGDVKYHSGFSSNIMTLHGPMHTALAFNPSHLEIIDPVVEGSVRARQDRRQGDGEDEVMAVLIHGDAAFAGQGVVMETLNMAETRAYTTGGTIHVVLNNQIGFTTSNPFDARSTLYCTDVANMVQAPVFHVNGDDPEAVLFITRLAMDYRARFKRDVVIDLLCYRRHGHNEADEPAVTQPIMYQFIRKKPTVRRLYAQQLIDLGMISQEDELRMEQEYQDSLTRNDVLSHPLADGQDSYPKPDWSPFFGQSWTAPATTALPAAALREISEEILALPPDFSLHARTQAIYDARGAMARGEAPIDWGYAETLAYASLLKAGYPIRFSGQDVGRGTFFHRHAILHDQVSGATYTPLQHLTKPAGWFQIYDSLLSEEGVLGFEYGYASSAPNVMVIWEAQFGDFANNAQVVIDQFISSGESKWGRLCGLTLLLPHGYEGQGPEHSSARIERYLQLCAEHNMQVAIPTSPAQIFHLLRRQMLRPYRKPLIVMTPKSLLRHKLAVSSLDELTQGRFEPLLDDRDIHDPSTIRRVVLCSGKVYYDLRETQRQQDIEGVAIVRIEQLYPFPDELLDQVLGRYPSMESLVWCQEEPENQGAWNQVKHRFVAHLKTGVALTYAGRPVCAAPAVGQFHRHIEEQKNVVMSALLG